jgi:opacity protein-like surface antigen
MKKKILTVLILAVATLFSTASAQRRFNVDLGLATFLMGAESVVGGGGSFGYHLAEKHLLSIDFAGGSISSQQIGTFDYTISYTDGTSKTEDGKITRGVGMSNTLVIYQFLTGTYESKFRGRFGGGLGMRAISSSDSYSPTSVDGEKITGLPTDMRDDHAYSPALALCAGAEWNFAKRWFLDFGYRAVISGASTVMVNDGRYWNLTDKKYSGFTNSLRVAVGFRF